MKTSDKPTQILNVTSTISQLQRHQLRRPIYQVRQKTPSTPKYTKYAKYTKSNTKYAKQKTKYLRQTKSMHAKHQICQKTPSTPSKTQSTPKNTKYGKKHQLRQNFHLCWFVAKKNQICQKKHQVRQAKRRVRQKTPNTSKNSNCAKIFIYADLSRNFFLLPILRDFWCTFYRPKNYGGVPKKTNMRYAYFAHRKFKYKFFLF